MPVPNLCSKIAPWMLVLFLTPAPVSAATIDVPADHATIQAAVDAAASGDTIRVGPGEYQESVYVTDDKHGLTIEASDPTTPPVIRGTPNNSDDGIRVDDIDDLTLRHLKIIGAYNGVRLNSARRALLMGLHIEDNALGIRVSQGEQNRVLQCMIVTTRVEQGILVHSSDDVAVVDTQVTDAAHGGVRVSNATCPVLDGVVAIDNRGSDGIKIEDAAGARVTDCTASGNYRNGFRVLGSPGLVLSGNIADENQDVGVRVEESDPYDSIASVAGDGNGGSGNGQAEILVLPPSLVGGPVVCNPPTLPTPTATSTLAPLATMTATPTPGPFGTGTVVPTPIGTLIPTVTPTPVATPTPTASVTPSPTATPTATRTGPTVVPTPAPSNLTHCQRSIARAAAKLAKTRLSVLRKCAERTLKGKRGPDPGPGARIAACLGDSGITGKLVRASHKLQRVVDRACGGLNGTCGDADDNLHPQNDLGFPAACPDLDAAGCTEALTDCGAIARCQTCLVTVSSDRAAGLAYDGLLVPASDSPTANKCRLAIGKETTKYLLARAKTLGKCWRDRYKWKHTDWCPNYGAQLRIRRADVRRIAKICRACGGDDDDCDQVVATVDPAMTAEGGTEGADDLTPAEIGFVDVCPWLTVPANASHGAVDCATPVDTLADLTHCLGCVADALVDCTDRAAHPWLIPYPDACVLP